MTLLKRLSMEKIDSKECLESENNLLNENDYLNKTKENDIKLEKNEHIRKEEETKTENFVESNNEKNLNNEKQTIEGMVVEDSSIPLLSITSRTNSYTLDELDKFLEQNLNTLANPGNDLIKPLIQHIDRKKLEVVELSNYDYGEKLKIYQKKLKNLLLDHHSLDDLFHEEKLLENRLIEIKKSYLDFLNERNKKTLQIQEDYQKKTQLLVEKHQKELEDFQIQWSDPKNLKEFNKPSPILIELRNKERSLALTENFKEAKEIKKRADKLEKLETEKAHEKALEGMKISLKTIEEKQKCEFIANERFYRKLLLIEEVRKKEEIKPFEMTIKKLEKQIINKNQQKKNFKQNKIINKNYILDEQKPKITPRTLQKKVNIKKKPLSKLLEIKGISNDEYNNTMNKNSPRKEKKN